ncbi:MAG: DUF4349 domain-containing protein [Cyanobacteria bacterium P01_D01_bin.115]
MMMRPASINFRLAALAGLLSLAATVGCSSAPTGSETAIQEAPASTSADNAVSAESAGDRSSSIPTPDLQHSPKLIKNAALRIESANVDEAVKAISNILAENQGDLLSLSDQENQAPQPRQVSLQIRVPQANLDNTLEALQNLGNVAEQTITAEDVAAQLVDLQARVRNLRKSEEALLEIMERSGSIPDVLEVSRELSTIREAIERQDAQSKALQSRVAYSTISLSLVSTQPLAPITSPVGETLSHTWQTATSTAQTVSISLLQLTLWLLVFSPYIGLVVLGGWVGQRYRRRQQPATEQTDAT